MVAGSMKVEFSEAANTDSALAARVAKLQSRLGLKLTATEAGTIDATGPVVLGIRMARLSDASLALGGGSTTVEATRTRPTTPTSFARRRRPTSLRSGPGTTYMHWSSGWETIRPPVSVSAVVCRERSHPLSS